MGGAGGHTDTQLAGYRIDAVIGLGGMGTVYRAEQLSLRRDVALKIMAPDLARDPSFRERFLRESLIAASLEHPHIVPIFDAGEVDQVLYIAMRYLAASDLRALIRRQGSLPPETTVSLLQQIAGALDAAHSRGLVHRDVKPSNVLIAEASTAADPLLSYLTDFGISKSAVETSGGSMGRPLGSVPYMAPEQIRGEPVDARADVYSLGCLLYECLTGEFPFARDSEVAVMYAHLEASPPRASDLRDLPATLDDVISWALAKSPADRPTSAGELASAAVRAVSDPSSARAASSTDAPAPATAAPIARASRRIVGRVSESARLLSALDEAAAGNGSSVLVAGEAGIGKTTLARWLCEEAERRGIATVWGSGGAFGEAPPAYWHWVQVMRALVRRPDRAALFAELGAATAWLFAIAPDVASALGALDPHGGPTRTDEGRFQVYDALLRMLMRAAGDQGLVVVLDDLHHADEASLLALAFMAALVHDTRVLLVSTYREELAEADGEPAAVASALADVVRASEKISIAGLDAGQVDQLIAARGGEEAPPHLTKRVHEVTGGNPLFVSELLNLLESEGRLAGAQIASGALPLPAGITDAIGQRLSPLPARGRQVLETGAVIGTSFRVATLARAASTSPQDVLDLLDHAVRLRLVRPLAEPADGYAFSHGLVQATVYEDLPRGRRVALHAAVGEALEHSFDIASGEGLAEVAYHFLEAAPGGNGERAIAYARRAADSAVKTFAYDEAVTLYRRALEITDASQERGRAALLQALGEAQMRAGDAAGARDTLQRAAAAARAHGDSEGLARAALACNIWGLSSGVDELLVRLAEEAVEQLESDGGSPGLLASCKGLLAAALYWSDQVERRERLAAEALALARAEHERVQSKDTAHVLAYVLGRYLITRWGPDSVERDLGLSDELIALSRQTRDSELEILARNWRVAVLLEAGDFSGVDREIARVEQMATELRQPRAMVFLLLHHATRALVAGRFAEAERLNLESMETGRRVRGTVGELAAGAQLVSIRLQQGRLGEVEAAVRMIANMHPGMVAFQCALALILVQSARRDEARAELERLTSAGLSSFPRDNTHILMLALLGDVAADLEDRQRARELFSWLEPYSGRWVVSPGAAALWPVDHSLARLAVVLGLSDLAGRHIDRAREQATRAGAAPSSALAALEEARMLAASGQDPARAAALAREARGVAQDLGMGLVVDAATLLEAEAG